MCKNVRTILLICYTTLYFSVNAQEYTVGQSYFDDKKYIEYIAGNLPIIISSSHGGDKSPDEIADRECENCVYGNDLYTQELTRTLADEINNLTGCYPHVIINRLRRAKLDANRSIEEAADGDPIAEQAWHDYNNFLDTANHIVTESYGKGIFFDLHGHGHEIMRLELGYLLNKTRLQLSDMELNSEDISNRTSIKNLIGSNLNGYDASELIRGVVSLGALIEEKGYPSVPSNNIKFPEEDDPYFFGGYNTIQNGSRDGGTIDAIQIECHQSVRFTTAERDAFAKELSVAIIDFLLLHYFEEEELLKCNIVSSSKNEVAKNLRIFPNPAGDQLYLETELTNYKLIVADGLGQKILELETPSKQIDISHIKPGYYIVTIETESSLLSTKLIKR
jgi:hypothetical protein